MKRGNVMTKSDDLIIWIMNVGRGLSIMIKTPQNYCVLYDLGSSGVIIKSCG